MCPKQDNREISIQTQEQTTINQCLLVLLEHQTLTRVGRAFIAALHFRKRHRQ